MAVWKTDPLYRLIFREIELIWLRVHEDCEQSRAWQPEAFRIEEHSLSDWDDSSHSRTLKDIWIFDDFGPRLFPGLRRVPHEAGEERGAFWQFGRIRFHISADRSYVALSYDLGPNESRDMGYDVESTGDRLVLCVDERSLSGSF
jgi:hypothetical protein